ncbi:MAG: lipoprotein [Myxococcales bacterium]|nr:lipoprotein [Myxococcales bacterium]
MNRTLLAIGIATLLSGCHWQLNRGGSGGRGVVATADASGGGARVESGGGGGGARGDSGGPAGGSSGGGASCH